MREQDDGQVEVSMRASPGHDVAVVALSLGGGGHARAAGCTVPGPLSQAAPRVLAAVFQALREQAGRH
jgi:phosphoesterase RecJ-like protein